MFIHFFAVYIFVLTFRPTSNRTIAARDRLTIYFYAVLSKDFKFDPNEDRLFIRFGHLIGTWEEDGCELFVTRYVFLHEVQVTNSFPKQS